jgi:hypothetical protein
VNTPGSCGIDKYNTTVIITIIAAAAPNKRLAATLTSHWSSTRFQNDCKIIRVTPAIPNQAGGPPPKSAKDGAPGTRKIYAIRIKWVRHPPLCKVPKDERFVDFMRDKRHEIESGSFPFSSKISAP